MVYVHPPSLRIFVMDITESKLRQQDTSRICGNCGEERPINWMERKEKAPSQALSFLIEEHGFQPAQTLGIMESSSILTSSKESMDSPQ
jgi:hypothetical protein